MGVFISRSSVLLYNPQLCTSCLQCQISCALMHGDSTGPANARIRVIDSHHLACPTVVASIRCDCPDGQELCQQVCGPAALRFVALAELPTAIKDGWHASPVEE